MTVFYLPLRPVLKLVVKTCQSGRCLLMACQSLSIPGEIERLWGSKDGGSFLRNDGHRMCKMLSERILCPLNWSQHRFLVHEMRVDALRRILWLSLMPIDAFYGYPFDSLFAGGNISGSECSPRPVAVSPAVNVTRALWPFLRWSSFWQ